MHPDTYAIGRLCLSPGERALAEGQMIETGLGLVPDMSRDNVGITTGLASFPTKKSLFAWRRWESIGPSAV